MVYRLKRLALNLRTDHRAVTAIEYAVIAAMIAVAVIGAITTIGGNIGTTLGLISSEL